MIAANFTCEAPTYLGARYPRGVFGAVDKGQETAVRFFREWNEQVRTEIPAERLLEFEVTQGWGPLCEFLGVPVPEEAFPRTNDTAQQLERLAALKRFCFGIWSTISLGMAGILYVCFTKSNLKL